MNILLITTHLEPGGVPYYTVSLADGLKQRGHNVYVASSGGMFTELLAKTGIEHIQINIRTKSELSPKIFSSFLKLRPLVKKHNIQIIHAQTRVAQVLAFWLSRLSGIPYVTTCHGFFRPRFFRKVFPFWGKKVIAISEAVEKHLKIDMKVKAQKIRLVHNGIDCNKYKSLDQQKAREFRARINLKGGPVIGIIARLSDVKGHRYLLEAFEKVLPQSNNLQLLIIGDGPMKSELEVLAKMLNIYDDVIFLPSVLDVVLALSVMDIFVMPSLQKGLGLSIMQAQAAGLPVIASNVGGIGTLIKHNETGMLVSPKDVIAIAQSILFLFADRDLAIKLGNNARKFIEDNFSLEKMVSKTEGLYQEVLR